VDNGGRPLIQRQKVIRARSSVRDRVSFWRLLRGKVTTVTEDRKGDNSHRGQASMTERHGNNRAR
jgi:hypothetical protein